MLSPRIPSSRASMPATKAKPRDELAGPRGLATLRGLVSSRHRNACRIVVTGLKVGVSEDSSIGLPSFREYSQIPENQPAQAPSVDASLGGPSRRIGDQMRVDVTYGCFRPTAARHELHYAGASPLRPLPGATRPAPCPTLRYRERVAAESRGRVRVASISAGIGGLSPESSHVIALPARRQSRPCPRP